MKKALSELFKEMSEQTTPAKKVAYFWQHANGSAEKILKMTYGKTEFDLPKGKPPYTPSKFDEPGNLYQEMRRMYLFIKGGHPTLSQVKREQLFISLLEFVGPDDAELVVGMKDGKLPYKGLSKKFITTNFPELFVDELDNEQDKEN